MRVLRTLTHIVGTSAIVVAAAALPVLMVAPISTPPMASNLGSSDTFSERPTITWEVMAHGTREQRTESAAPPPHAAPRPSPEPIAVAADLEVPAARPVQMRIHPSSLMQHAIPGSGAMNLDLAPPVARLRAADRLQANEAPPQPRRRAKKPCDRRVEGIVEILDGYYAVQRSVLDHYATLKEGMRLAHVAWHKDDAGKKDGFSIYRIGCGNPLAQVGLKNGDVIHTINGHKVKSIPQALVVVARVKRKERIEVIGSRRGEPIRIVADVL
jgi:hypothetical protein